MSASQPCARGEAEALPSPGAMRLMDFIVRWQMLGFAAYPPRIQATPERQECIDNGWIAVESVRIGGSTLHDVCRLTSLGEMVYVLNVVESTQ